MKISGALVARLLYLLHTNEEVRIPKELLKHIPGSKFITALLDGGIGGSDINPGVLDALLEEGGKDRPGSGDAKEAVIIIQRLVDDSLRQDTRLELRQRLKIYRILEGLQATMAEQTVEIDLAKPGEITPIPKFNTGFQPLDAVMGGAYQAIIMLLAPPGAGKTSLMISMMEALRINDHPGSILMLENEIPAPMMKGRFSDVFRRCKFKDGDKLICGPWSANHILQYIKENPDPERIVFFDSPDVMIGGGGDLGKRFFLEAEYITLIEIKRRCKAVIVASWPNRKNPTVTHFNDVSEAVAKAWYSDAVIGINPMANNRLQFLGLKNRFGPNGNDITFEYDYESLTWGEGSVEVEADFWAALQAEADAQPVANGHVNGRA